MVVQLQLGEKASKPVTSDSFRLLYFILRGCEHQYQTPLQSIQQLLRSFTEKHNFQSHGGALGKVRGSLQLFGSILWAPQILAQHCVALHELDIFQTQQSARPTDIQTLSVLGKLLSKGKTLHITYLYFKVIYQIRLDLFINNREIQLLPQLKMQQVQGKDYNCNYISI